MFGRKSGLAERAVRAAGEDLADECKAFLSGDAALATALRGEAPASWQWLNALAHRSHEQLVEMAALGLPMAPGSLSVERWQAVVRFLAAHLLDLVSTGLSLADLQRAVLVPLELELAADPDASLTPLQARRLVLVRLPRLRRS